MLTSTTLGTTGMLILVLVLACPVLVNITDYRKGKCGLKCMCDASVMSSTTTRGSFARHVTRCTPITSHDNRCSYYYYILLSVFVNLTVFFRRSVQVRSRSAIECLPKKELMDCWCELFLQTRNSSRHKTNSVNVLHTVIANVV